MIRRGQCLVAIAGGLTLLGTPFVASAQTSPSLGNATSYAVLAGSAVTNTGTTTIAGDVGISPGIGPTPHVSGFGTVVLAGGAVHDADTQAANAQFDSGLAYGAIDQPCTFTYAGTKELAGITLGPGVHCATSFHLTAGVLTLAGTAADTWIFKSASDLVITGGASSRVISPSCNVWWRVVSSATFDAGSSLTGNVLADTSVTLAANATLNGRAFARTAAVTLSSNSITSCVAPVIPRPAANACAATAPELLVIKSHVGTFVVGTQANYFLAIANNGVTGNAPMTVTDTLPAGLTFVSATGVDWRCSAVAQVVTCTTNASTPNRIILTVMPGAGAAPSVTNTAVISGGGDCDLTNNSSSDVTVVATSVPTLPEWAFLMMGGLLALSGIIALRRRIAP